MGCFVHVILLRVGCFVSLKKNMWWFSSTYNKMDVGGYVRGVFCPYTESFSCRPLKCLKIAACDCCILKNDLYLRVLDNVNFQ